MSGIVFVETIEPAVLGFRGPDAVRFLNGQVTQDVRRVVGGALAVHSCVTDAKGKLQFRVTITEGLDGSLWVATADVSAEDLETRLTRYLIADDVETKDLTGQFVIHHFIGSMPPPPDGVMAREINRVGVVGIDWWVPTGADFALPEHSEMSADERETLRIRHGVPVWGRELTEGMLPPEAALEVTDISYQKGCYIGQEVISRIKSAGKVNRRLTRFEVAADAPVTCGPLDDRAGEITSVAPLAEGEQRHALGFLRRVAEAPFAMTVDDIALPVRVR